MGVCQSKKVQKQTAVNRTIETDLRFQKAVQANTVKLLLLGPGECGKSTILKQMRIIHEKGFSDRELEIHKGSIYLNIVESMVAILNFMSREGMELDDKELLVSEAKFLILVNDQRRKYSYDLEMSSILKNLWADRGLQRVCERKTEILLSDGAYYFFENLDRIYTNNYKPTQEDVLRIRVATCGVVEVTFKINKFEFRVFDVGGQMSERKKWIHVFDDVNAIVFIVALNDYDKVLREDSTVNSMDDTMGLFADTINNGFFQETLIILFLNKTDLFAQKIISVSIKIAFPCYEGPQTYNDCLLYIRQQLLSLNQNGKREIRTHETCATDTNQVQVVIRNSTEKIIEKMVQTSGVM